MKTIDLGKNMDETAEIVTSAPSPSKTIYPSLYLSNRAGLDDAPDAGKEGTATIKYKVVSKNESERLTESGVEETYSVDLEIMSITFNESESESDSDMIEKGLSEEESDDEMESEEEED